MIAMRRMSSVRVLGLALLGAASCGLLNSDISKVSFELPAKSYAFNASQWHLPASTPAIPCGAGQVITDCCNPPALPGVTKPNCAVTPLACDAGVCTAHITISVANPVDLKQEVPVLANVNNQSLANISLGTLTYAVTNTLNVKLPALELYLAPDGITDAKDPSAIKFGTVPEIPAMTPANGDVVKEPDADATFAMFGHAISTPFNFIATTTVVIPSGSPTPTGMVSITVNGTVTAKLAL
jgi:hypothetical protein